jgi:hypothetical protein
MYIIGMGKKGRPTKKFKGFGLDDTITFRTYEFFKSALAQESQEKQMSISDILNSMLKARYRKSRLTQTQGVDREQVSQNGRLLQGQHNGASAGRRFDRKPTGEDRSVLQGD